MCKKVHRRCRSWQKVERVQKICFPCWCRTQHMYECHEKLALVLPQFYCLRDIGCWDGDRIIGNRHEEKNHETKPKNIK